MQTLGLLSEPCWDEHHHLFLILHSRPVLQFLPVNIHRGKALPTQSLLEETIWFTSEPHSAQFTPSPKGAELGKGGGPGILGLQAAFLQYVIALCDTGKLLAPLLATVSLTLKWEMTCVF